MSTNSQIVFAAPGNGYSAEDAEVQAICATAQTKEQL